MSPEDPPVFERPAITCLNCGTTITSVIRRNAKGYCYACFNEKEQGALSKSVTEARVKVQAIADAAKRAQRHERDREHRRVKAAMKRDREREQQRQADPVQNKLELELASRELARRSLLHYIERTSVDYQPGWVHEDICRRLEQFVRDVEARRSPRLMLWLPPRSGKSTIASNKFPAWVLGKHPEWEFIMASYSLELPLGFSRQVRAQVSSPEYRAIFPNTLLSKDSQAAESWRTTRNGGLRAAGTSGSITGMGCSILVVDDPVKDSIEADSETARNSVFDWYSSTAYTRLAPGGGILCIQTRWHDDDLSGRLQTKMRKDLKEIDDELVSLDLELARTRHYDDQLRVKRTIEAVKTQRQTVDQWEIVSYPAIATHNEYLELRTGKIVTDDEGRPPFGARLLRRQGEALHPERFPLELLLKYKRTLQPRHWSALYQQNPVPDEGLYFTADMFRYRPHLPEVTDLHVFAAWDLAIGIKNTNDFTVGVVGGIDADDNLWILDLVRGKWGDTHQIATLILDTSVRYNAMLTGIEKGQLELAVKPHLERLMNERRSYIALAEGESALKPVTDKLIRARPLQGRMQQGKVVFPSDQPWVETLRHELMRFPGGMHDDIVDALAWLARMVSGQAPPRKKTAIQLPPNHRPWRDRLTGFLKQEPKNFMAR